MYEEYRSKQVIIQALQITDAESQIFVKITSERVRPQYVFNCPNTDIVIEFHTNTEPKNGDYIIRQSSTDIYLCPEKVFKEKYAPNTLDNWQFDQLQGDDNASFGWALCQLEAGMKVCREGWNGKRMFLFLVPGSTFKVNRPPLLGIYPEGTEINYHAHIDMKTATGEIVPWLASQTDMLAKDWQVLIDGE